MINYKFDTNNETNEKKENMTTKPDKKTIKRTVETVKNELSKITDKIEIMLEKGVSETNPKFDKLNTKQNDLDHELDFLTNIMGEK